MSNKTDVTPLILDIVEFLSALTDLKRATRKAESLQTADGKTVAVDYVFEDGTGRQAGLRKSEKGFEVVKDCHGLPPEAVKVQEKSVNEIVRRYAQRKVVKELQAQGYTVAEEEKRADGTIRLLARKWG